MLLSLEIVITDLCFFPLLQVVGAGASGGSMDAGNLLKPMLGRGELRCIGKQFLCLS